jgi:hypothetical protein
VTSAKRQVTFQHLVWSGTRSSFPRVDLQFPEMTLT